ncbi:sugar phosphate nucleotidyltransferase [uncultured Brevundimonas sp.]|uniref:sugar phosphate nucleotidyltransferase n=1 Tax=uncultured Brevundimonas sp. TaxID=213418 RepID=UPI00263398DE|nr:sugar phosphate nucleotidyltransferase [uncultured Brevundimonas sp.]
MVEQCAILLGGLGTRLGELTRQTPKPLLPVDGKPFVELLIREAWRMGFRKVLLLAGYKSERVEAMIEELRGSLPDGCSIDISVESEPLGTGGAVVNALSLLDERFLLINGDTWFDFNWNRLIAGQSGNSAAIGVREVSLADRYETIRLDADGTVTGVINRGEAFDPPFYVNGGVYCFTREHFVNRPRKFSLEADLLPSLAAEGLMKAHISEGYFLDIGIPDTYARSQVEIPARRTRPVVLISGRLVIEAAADTATAVAAANEAGHVVLALGLSASEVKAANAGLRQQAAHIDGVMGHNNSVGDASLGFKLDASRVLVVGSSEDNLGLYLAARGLPVLSVNELANCMIDARGYR